MERLDCIGNYNWLDATLGVNMNTSTNEHKRRNTMNIQTLAKEMNVTESYVKSLLLMVISGFEKDKVTDIFISMTEEQQNEMVQAYVVSEVKKFFNFCTELLVNPQKKNAFDLYVLSLIKDEEA